MRGIFQLDLTFEFNGLSHTIWPTLIADGGDLLLVDAAYPGQLALLEEAVVRAGCSFSDISLIVATHHDFDHIGALGEIRRKYPRIAIAASEEEAMRIDGRQPSLRLLQARALQDGLPADQRAGGSAFIQMLESVETVTVDRILKNGELLPLLGGIQVIHTPGHTPGHLSLYCPGEQALISGDAAVLEAGELRIANPQYTLDMEAASESFRMLLALNPRNVYCYHGGCAGDCPQRK